jgi:hypothetical protein
VVPFQYDAASGILWNENGAQDAAVWWHVNEVHSFSARCTRLAVAIGQGALLDGGATESREAGETHEPGVPPVRFAESKMVSNSWCYQARCDGALRAPSTAQRVMLGMEARGWLRVHAAPCAALRSCGRLDVSHCRADATLECGFPRVLAASHVLVCCPRAPQHRTCALSERTGVATQMRGFVV